MSAPARVQRNPQDTFHQSQSQVNLNTDFDNMLLHQHLVRGIYSYGFEHPTAIQQRAIVPFKNGDDIIARCGPGMGKTAAFCIGALARLDFTQPNTLQALIVAPALGQAIKISDVISQLGDYLSDHTSFCCAFFDGDRVPNVPDGTMVAVGTPGRVSDLISSGALRTDALKVMVLDHADELLSRGCIDHIHEIFKVIPRNAQVALFAAFMPQFVLDIATKYMRNPTRLADCTLADMFENVKQFYVAVEEQDKLDTLMDLLTESVSISQSVTFANTRRKVDHIAETVEARKKENKKIAAALANRTVATMHDGISKGELEVAASAFASGSSPFLITTDSAARGNNSYHANIVINHDLPAHKKDYLRRVARGGPRRRIAISLVSRRDVELLREIEEYYHIQIEELPMDFMSYL